MTNNFNLDGTVEDLFDLYDQMDIRPELQKYVGAGVCHTTPEAAAALTGKTYCVQKDANWDQGLHFWESGKEDGTDFAIDTQEAAIKPVKVTAELKFDRLFDATSEINEDFLREVRNGMVEICLQRGRGAERSVTYKLAYRLIVGHFSNIQGTRYFGCPVLSDEDRRSPARPIRFGIKVHEINCVEMTP